MLPVRPQELVLTELLLTVVLNTGFQRLRVQQNWRQTGERMDRRPNNFSRALFFKKTCSKNYNNHVALAEKYVYTPSLITGPLSAIRIMRSNGEYSTGRKTSKLCVQRGERVHVWLMYNTDTIVMCSSYCCCWRRRRTFFCTRPTMYVHYKSVAHTNTHFKNLFEHMFRISIFIENEQNFDFVCKMY